MKNYRLFAIIPTTGEGYWYLIPEAQWRRVCSGLYNPLGTDIVERTQVRDDVGKLRWMWCDEMGHPRRRAFNSTATRLYRKERSTTPEIVGDVALELGKITDESFLDEQVWPINEKRPTVVKHWEGK